jgi:glucokinase
MVKKDFIGVDVGGTKIHVARICQGEVLNEVRIPTGANRLRDEIIKDMVNSISLLMTREVIGIGIGVPGLVDSKNGVISNVANIPSWKNLPIRNILSDIFKVPVFVGNDANCFALGEKYFGKGASYNNLVGVTLGTGVGAGVIVNNRLQEGVHALAGEFGGIKYLDSDYENYCSGKFFRREYGREAIEVASAAAANDLAAYKIFQKFGNHVGYLIQTIMYSVAPEAIIIGGSLSKAFPYFKTGMNEVLDLFPHKEALRSTFIDISEKGTISVLGAGALVLESQPDSVSVTV